MAMGEARGPILKEERAPHHAADGAKPPSQLPLSPGATVVTSLVAGAIAGAIAKTVVAPLDRTKINFQISDIPYSWRGAARFVADTVRTEGVAALWRGNSATMARIIPYAAIQFTAHEQWKRALGVDTPQSAQEFPWWHLLAGSLAGVTSQSATYPLDMARARMAVTSARDYCSLKAVFVNVVRHEGLRTLYRGYLVTMMGVVPYAGISFFTYDTFKHKYLAYFGEKQSPLTNILFGGAAGALAQTATYPLDVIRRRMQTSRRRPDGSYPHATVASSWMTVWRTEGVRGFFKGLTMNWVKGPIAVGVSFATYDYIRGGLRDSLLAAQRFGFFTEY